MPTKHNNVGIYHTRKQGKVNVFWDGTCFAMKYYALSNLPNSGLR